MKRWPLHKAYFWETTPFSRILLPVVAGILFYSCTGRDYQHASFCNFYPFLILISFLVLVALELLRPGNDFLKYLRFFLFNIIFLLGSWAICWFNDIRNDTAWFGNGEIDKGALSYIACIDGDPVEKNQTWKIALNIVGSHQGNEIKAAHGKAFIYVYKNGFPLPFVNGDTVLVPDSWREIKNQSNPFEFDYALYCARNNLYYQQFLPLHKISMYSKSCGNSKTIIEKCHDWCMQQLEIYIPDASTKGLIQAMLLGDEVNLDEQIRTSYAETGIVHIIAISGGNVTIFFLVISYLLWWLRNKKHVWIKYLAALPLVWLYVIMAGAAPSAVRAALMFSILSIGFLLQKNRNSLNDLFATAVILLFAEPMWLFSVGFQLSFIAVLSLILFYQPIYKLLSPSGKITIALWGTICASLAAEILVAPLVVYYFHIFPLLFIIANFAAFLFMSLALVLAMAIVALSFIPFVAHALGVATAYMVIHFNKGISWMQGLNPISFHFLRLSSLELALLYICFAGLAVFILKKTKNALFIGTITACILMFLFCCDEWTALHQRRLVVYNINKITHIEITEGKCFKVLNTDSIVSEKKKAYTLKPAHTMWMEWENKEADNKEIFLLGDKSVLILKAPIKTEDHFPVDYVIISYPVKKMSPAPIQQIFNPRTIILGNNNPRRTLNRWYSNAIEKNISLHLLTFKGAFVLE